MSGQIVQRNPGGSAVVSAGPSSPAPAGTPTKAKPRRPDGTWAKAPQPPEPAAATETDVRGPGMQGIARVQHNRTAPEGVTVLTSDGTRT